ncbi:MAG: hypothetical protein E7633_03245 [Ruminococcaceae bacterium]|nr:hypothetical protein [Oscillospiraceae bacterium]
MKKTLKTATITIAVLLVIATVLTAGLLILKKSPFMSGDSGTIILSVNPEIRIDYDKDGKVTSVKGNNKDGKDLLSELDSFVGLSYIDAVKALVKEIYNAGYFAVDIDGERRNIVVRVEPGSVLPEKNFADKLESEITNTVKSLNVDPQVITIGHDDYDPKYTNSLSPSQYISLEKAKEIALAHAGISASDAFFDDREFDFERGRAVYELEFYANGSEYDYEIDATTGEVVKHEWEIKKAPDKTNSDKNTVENNQSKENGNNVAPTGNATHLDNVPDTPVNPEDPTTPETPAEPAQPTYITLEEAKAIVLKDAGVSETEAIFDDREFDFEHGKAVYELEFYANGVEYEYDVDAVSGEILRKKTDGKKPSETKPETPVTPESPSNPSETTPVTYITAEKAKEIALKDSGLSASEVRFDDCEFDVEHGKAVYEIDFESGRYEFEYKIDAVSGEIVKAERDYDD